MYFKFARSCGPVLNESIGLIKNTKNTKRRGSTVSDTRDDRLSVLRLNNSMFSFSSSSASQLQRRVKDAETGVMIIDASAQQIGDKEAKILAAALQHTNCTATRIQ
jgi:archaeosine-15-forming tRNA-guanine transglycosylase